MSFYKVLTNSVVSQVTNMSVWFGLIFFVYLETRSVFATSIVSGIYLVAVALSGFWLGGFVDRFRKKIIMLLSSAFSLVIYVLGLSLYLAVGRLSSVIQEAHSSGQWSPTPHRSDRRKHPGDSHPDACDSDGPGG
jgi:MFS family permease